MLQISLDNYSDIPIYQQLVDSITAEILSGTLPAGYQLPTLRTLSAETGISQGTIKHAYDLLEQHGLVQKTQGRGTFVRDVLSQPTTSKKEQALAAIDELLDRMRELSFSIQDTRIFLDLKLRERENSVQNVRIGAVDCSPEALSMISSQVSELPYVDVYQYLLQPILDAAQPFSPNLDIVVTTPSHFDALREKMPPDQNLQRMVLAPTPGVVLELARIDAEEQVGILCVSERFSSIVQAACQKYCILHTPPKTAQFGDNLQGFFHGIDQLILPPNYLQFCSPQELNQIQEYRKGGKIILYEYSIQKGSLLHLEEQIERIYRANRQKS